MPPSDLDLPGNRPWDEAETVARRGVVEELRDRSGSGSASSNDLDSNNDVDKFGKELEVTSQKSVSSGELLAGGSRETSHSHIFQDPEIAEYYRKVYEASQYEGRHLFDPSFEWEPQEERKVKWKTEWYVCFWAFIMFVALDIDRVNMSNAVADGILGDLKLTTADYNLGNTINLVCFLSAELPSQLISKKLGPDRWIPIQMVLWSVVAITQCAITNRGGFLVTRALVGLLEGGFIPDVILWMSYFYTGSEMSSRISFFYIANPLTNIFSSLLAYGIFHIKSSNGWEGWRWMFLIEGLVTLIMGLLAIFKMPPSVTQTKTWYRKKGWYTDREEKIMVNRVLRDDPTKGDMHNREAITFKSLWLSITDYDLWPVYVNRLFIDLISGPLSKYLPILLKSMGFKGLNINLLMIPNQAITIVTMLLQAHSSQYFKEYAFHWAITPLWILGPLVAMHSWPGFLVNKWASYAVVVIALAGPPSWVLSVSWASQNSGSVRTRTVSASLVNMFGQSAGIINSNIFRPDDAPRYHRGTGQLIAFSVVGTILTAGSRWYYILRNKQKQAKWEKLSEDEQREYRLTTTDQGNRRLDFKFVY